MTTRHTPAELAARFAEPLPRTGRGMAEIVARLRDDVIAESNHLYHPRYVGHQVSASLPAAVWTESLIGALNQSVAVFEMSPVGTVLETQVIRWMCDLVGCGAGAGGTLTSGGTEATQTALLAARGGGDARRHGRRAWGRIRRWSCTANTRTTRCRAPWARSGSA